jgi:hypothetical protein
VLRGGSLLLEKVDNGSVDDKQDTSSWSETENFGKESLVQSGETFLLCDKGNRRESPVVLWYDTRDTDGVLDSRFDDIGSVILSVRTISEDSASDGYLRSVEKSTNGSSDATSNQIIRHLSLLGVHFW